MKLAQAIGYPKKFKIPEDSADMGDRVPQLLENQSYDQAVEVLYRLKKYRELLDVCEQYGVGMTEEMAEEVTPKDAKDPQRNATLLRIAKICKRVSLYKVAAKKYL